jgi:mono/diheme cytochrome c family protein
MSAKRFAILVLIAAAVTHAELAAHAQPKPAADAKEGRAFALRACTGCHIVASDQPFKPIHTGDIHPPDFKDIANKSGVTVDSLIHYLDMLPTIPKDSRMANADLTAEQTRDVVAYILSLRDKQPAPVR